MGKIKKRVLACVVGTLFVSISAFQSKVYAAEKTINFDCIKGFNYFFLEDFSCHSMHTEGKLAVGGTLKSTCNLSICTNEPTDEPTLVIGKGAEVKDLQDKYGYCTIEDNCKDENLHFNSFDIQSHHDQKAPIRENVFDFDKVGQTLKEYSKELSNLKSNETAVKDNGRMILKSDKTEGTAVFEITAEDIKDVSQQIDVDIDPKVTVLINVKGNVVDIPNSGGIKVKNTYDVKYGESNTKYYGNIMWNFNEANKINLGLSYMGTILAPNADINITSPGHIEGQFMAKSFTQPYDIQYAAYEGHLNMFNRSFKVETAEDEGGSSSEDNKGGNTGSSTEVKPTDDKKTEDSKKDETTTEQKPAEDKKTDDSKKDETTTEQKPVEDKKPVQNNKTQKPVKDVIVKADTESKVSNAPQTINKKPVSKNIKHSSAVKTGDKDFNAIVLLAILSCAVLAGVKLIYRNEKYLEK